MGRTDYNTNSTKVKSPMKIYVSFNAGEGNFNYWDGKELQVLPNLEMVVMDTRASIGGWSKQCDGRIFSNYFKSVKDKVFVRASNKDILSGTYEEDKEKIKAAGGKYQTNVFALCYINSEWVPAVVQFSASSLAAWAEFNKDVKPWDLYKTKVSIGKSDLIVNGKVKYYMPTFKMESSSPDVLGLADEFYTSMLKPYLEQTEKEAA